MRGASISVNQTALVLYCQLVTLSVIVEDHYCSRASNMRRQVTRFICVSRRRRNTDAGSSEPERGAR